MTDFKVTAKQYGSSVEFTISASDIKEALSSAHIEARAVFDYHGQGDDPTVSIKEVREPKES